MIMDTGCNNFFIKCVQRESYEYSNLDYFRSLSGLPEGIQRKRTVAKRQIKESAWTVTNVFIIFERI